MASFEKAIKEILKHEGGYVNNAKDPGGATNYGVSIRLLADHPELGDFDGDGDVDIEDIKNMTIDDATKVYKTLWWDKYGYEKFIRDDIALKIFDFSVNAGGSRAHKILQESLNSYGLKLTVDGIIGNATYQAVNAFDTDETAHKFLNVYRAKQTEFYTGLVTSKPNLGIFLKGWLNRVNAC